ncbi:hypothetical protein WN944_001521 [Citrus x changshan-huyou]|uniref:Uncharacterized protein n=1 Tax=Citrus x changshan-huyou TaxID=2935761 RepID=A0AAP0QQU8_9ROSI
MRNYCNKTSKGSEIIILVVYSTRAQSIVILSPQREDMTPATCKKRESNCHNNNSNYTVVIERKTRACIWKKI